MFYRSQRDILNRKPITEALQDEREFFARHSQYHILGQKVGTTFLGHRCNEVRTDSIHTRHCNSTLQIAVDGPHPQDIAWFAQSSARSDRRQEG